MTKSRSIEVVLITGIAGSGGSYLAEYIVNNYPKVAVHGICRWHSTSTQDNLAAVSGKMTMHECDLNDFSSVFTVLREVKPDAIFHVASHANVHASFVNPLAVLQNNIMSTANLFEAVRLSGLDPWIQLCSTSEVYGQVFPDEVPIKENQPIRASSPYAVSKVAQDLLGVTYFRSYQMKVIRTRMFAYINPRRADLFASSFARQVARIEAGLQKELVHGNLDSVRTMIDVRDAVRAYWLAIQMCEAGEDYNIGGSRVISVGEFLDIVKKRSKVPIASRLDTELLRPADITYQIPDVSKFVKTTGWKPRYSFEESVQYLLDYWREKVQKESEVKMQKPSRNS